MSPVSNHRGIIMTCIMIGIFTIFMFVTGHSDGLKEESTRGPISDGTPEAFEVNITKNMTDIEPKSDKITDGAFTIHSLDYRTMDIHFDIYETWMFPQIVLIRTDGLIFNHTTELKPFETAHFILRAEGAYLIWGGIAYINMTISSEDHSVLSAFPVYVVKTRGIFAQFSNEYYVIPGTTGFGSIRIMSTGNSADLVNISIENGTGTVWKAGISSFGNGSYDVPERLIPSTVLFDSDSIRDDYRYSTGYDPAKDDGPFRHFRLILRPYAQIYAYIGLTAPGRTKELDPGSNIWINISEEHQKVRLKCYYPDFQVTEISFPHYPILVGSTRAIDATISDENEDYGEIDHVFYNLTVALFIDGDRAHTWTIEELESSYNTEFTLDDVVFKAPYKFRMEFKFIVDADDKYQELNEDNNTMTRTENLNFQLWDDYAFVIVSPILLVSLLAVIITLIVKKIRTHRK